MKGKLEMCNTPLQHGLSPSQHLFGHPIRSFLPALANSLSFAPRWKEVQARRSWLARKNRTKEYFDHCAHPLHPLQIGDKVRIQWSQSGIIVNKKGSRAYLVKTPFDSVLQ